jgi:hypothetical protein
MGREEMGDSHPIINEWGRAWVVPGQVRAVELLLSQAWAKYTYIQY